jgi:hypothetical protein
LSAFRAKLATSIRVLHLGRDLNNRLMKRCPAVVTVARNRSYLRVAFGHDAAGKGWNRYPDES